MLWPVTNATFKSVTAAGGMVSKETCAMATLDRGDQFAESSTALSATKYVSPGVKAMTVICSEVPAAAGAPTSGTRVACFHVSSEIDVAE